MQALVFLEEWPPLLLEYLDHAGNAQVRLKDHVLAQLPCGCIAVVQARVLKDKGYVPGNNHQMQAGEEVQQYPCKCCDNPQVSSTVKAAAAEVKHFVTVNANRKCLFLVEMPVDLSASVRARRRADLTNVPIDAEKFDQCVVVEFDPTGHFLNPDTRGAATRRMQQSEKFDHVTDRDSNKDELYDKLGVWLWRMSAEAMSGQDVRAQALATRFAARLRKAGIM